MITLEIKNARDLGLAIRERRIAAGLDQDALAAKIGFSRLGVNETEKAIHASNIADALKSEGIDHQVIDLLIEEISERAKPSK